MTVIESKDDGIHTRFWSQSVFNGILSETAELQQQKVAEKHLQGQRRRASCETRNAWTCSSTLGEYNHSLSSCLSHGVVAVKARQIYLHYSPGVPCGAFAHLSGAAKSFCIQPNSYRHITPNIAKIFLSADLSSRRANIRVCRRCVTATFNAELAPAERQSLKRSGAKLCGQVAKLIKCQAWRWDYDIVLRDGLAQTK